MPAPASLLALGATAQSLLQAQQHTPVLMSLFDRHDMLIWANDAFRTAFGLAPEQYLTWHDMMVQSQHLGVGSLIETDNLEQWLTSVLSRRGKQAFRAFEADLYDGRWLWMTETVCADGSMLCMACDITHLRHGERHLRQERDIAMRAALTDPLTRIGNRAHILSLLDKHMHRVQQRQGSCGVVLIDLDHFKRVNDGYGHDAGDRVLQHFAKLLPQVLRREDCYGRIGGEEFLLLLPNATSTSLPDLVQRLISILPLHRPLEEAPDFFYTCSAGITLVQADDTTATLMRRVDGALYNAKHQGRARLVWADALDT